MAESTKTPKTSADERLFTIPLRKSWLKVPRNKRSKRSISTIRAYLSRHMKAPEADIRISAKLNDNIWVRGAAKPPGKVRIKASFDAEAGLLFASLPDEVPSPAKKGDKKDAKPDKEGILEKVKEAAEKATSTKDGAPKAQASKEEAKEAVEEAVAEARAAEGKPAEKPEPKKAEKPKTKPAEKKDDKSKTTKKAPSPKKK